MPEKPDLRPERADLSSRTDNIFERAVFRHGRKNFRSERADFRPERTDFVPERADSRLKKVDCRPEMANFRLWRPNGEQMDKRMDQQAKDPQYSTGHCPLQGHCPKTKTFVIFSTFDSVKLAYLSPLGPPA